MENLALSERLAVAKAAAAQNAPAAQAAALCRREPGWLLTHYRQVRARSLALAAPLSAEDQVVQSMPDASPTKWHLAHTTWFFETMVLSEVKEYVAFDPSYGYLFNSYYEALGPRQPRASRGLITRPSVEEVQAYRAYVDQALEARLVSGALDRKLLGRLVLGLAHEEQHQELLLTDALHLLAQNPLRPVYDKAWRDAALGAPGPARFVPFSGGVVQIGAASGDGLDRAFRFDNEGPAHRTYLQPFRLADRLVSNREWLAFINDGGYRRPELWLSDGWAQVGSEAWTAPLYWDEGQDGWLVFGPRGLELVSPDQPVRHVSYFEADAFARWSGRRLPTEAQWEFAASARADAFDQLFGAVWQWTASAYAPYPGFRPGEGALGEYNGKFMINQMVLRGSSWATSPGHSRPSYRNFFQPHHRWQATGVRLADDVPA